MTTTWELDSDEIASIASEDLHEHRPNRWRGPKSTWRTLTEEDRLLWQSMKQLHDQDLSVHLYNAFALKRRGRDPATVKDLMVDTVSATMTAHHLSTVHTCILIILDREMVMRRYGHLPSYGRLGL